MYQAGSPSWRFMEDDAQFLHLALFMRDAAGWRIHARCRGLAVTRSDDIPPPLAGEVPGQAARQLLHDIFTTGRGRT